MYLCGRTLLRITKDVFSKANAAKFLNAINPTDFLKMKTIPDGEIPYKPGRVNHIRYLFEGSSAIE